ncbi:MAG TPA: DUF397 domain-containing protein [Pseudonocardiaceae bacterium]|nr:DUF397 domain-containing protein [Pseudonocardiaceae bacterium]
MTVDPRWRKSTRSAPEANCVEVHYALDSVRDSKNPGPRLTVNVHALVVAIRTGRI